MFKFQTFNDYIVSSSFSKVWRCKGHHKTWLSLLRVQKCLHVYDPDTRWLLRRCSVLQWTGIFQMSPPDPIIIRNSKHFTYVSNRLVISDSDNQSATLQCRCNKLTNVIQNTVLYPETRGFVSYKTLCQNPFTKKFDIINHKWSRLVVSITIIF